jgi:hypothetical protein
VDQEGRLQIQADDELVSGPLVTRDGHVVYGPARAEIDKK